MIAEADNRPAVVAGGTLIARPAFAATFRPWPIVPRPPFPGTPAAGPLVPGGMGPLAHGLRRSTTGVPGLRLL